VAFLPLKIRLKIDNYWISKKTGHKIESVAKKALKNEVPNLRKRGEKSIYKKWRVFCLKQFCTIVLFV
jgi:hypothetical protein